MPDPNNADDVAYFQAQQNFMFTVFDLKMKTDKAASLVRQHEGTRNAQAVWTALLAHQQTSTNGEIRRTKLMNHLMNYQLDSTKWKGTYVGFITHWKEQKREYDKNSRRSIINSVMR
jgi:hypothetical protein